MKEWVRSRETRLPRGDGWWRPWEREYQEDRDPYSLPTNHSNPIPWLVHVELRKVSQGQADNIYGIHEQSRVDKKKRHSKFPCRIKPSVSRKVLTDPGSRVQTDQDYKFQSFGWQRWVSPVGFGKESLSSL